MFYNIKKLVFLSSQFMKGNPTPKFTVFFKYISISITHKNVYETYFFMLFNILQLPQNRIHTPQVPYNITNYVCNVTVSVCQVAFDVLSNISLHTIQKLQIFSKPSVATSRQANLHATVPSTNTCERHFNPHKTRILSEINEQANPRS